MSSQASAREEVLREEVASEVLKILNIKSHLDIQEIDVRRPMSRSENNLTQHSIKTLSYQFNIRIF